MTPGLPARLGPYRLQGVLRRGRSGETHRAFDTAHDRVVALELLAADPADREYRARVDRACRIVAHLRNPHVVTVHDHGVLDGRLYVAQRLVEGTDLAALLAREGPPALARTADLVDQVASGLAAAHARGLAHRDLRPAHVHLEHGTDRVAVDGFGIASPSGLSLDHAAPERIRGTASDHREDVYALGCLLFLCLTGERPYPGRSLPERMRGHLEGAIPRPSQRRDAVPTALDGVVATAMAKAPGHRYDTVGRLASALRAAVPV